MPVLEIEIKNHIHMIACGTGQEARLLHIASEFKKKAEELGASTENLNEKTLYLMAAIILIDEIDEKKGPASGLGRSDSSEISTALDGMAARLEAIVEKFESSTSKAS